VPVQDVVVSLVQTVFDVGYRRTGLLGGGGDERDLDRGRRDACERHEELEEREARDRVEERRDDAERLLVLKRPLQHQAVAGLEDV